LPQAVATFLLMSTVSVQLPVYPLVDGSLMRALEHSSSVRQEVSDEVGEAYLLFAEVILSLL
jgi:hypothetical protein